MVDNVKNYCLWPGCANEVAEKIPWCDKHLADADRGSPFPRGLHDTNTDNDEGCDTS
jgi:hypothetical protein